MSDSPERNPPYRVDWSAVVAESLRELQRQASRAGIGEPFLAAFKQIVERLHNDPAEAGEPLYRLPVLRMQVRCVVVSPLVIHYAVCEDQPLVIIKGGSLLSDA